MYFHSLYGQHFLGLRTSLTGQKEVVYDGNDSQRVVLKISEPSCAKANINAALRSAVNGRNVLASLRAEFSARDIVVTETVCTANEPSLLCEDRTSKSLLISARQSLIICPKTIFWLKGFCGPMVLFAKKLKYIFSSKGDSL